MRRWYFGAATLKQGRRGYGIDGVGRDGEWKTGGNNCVDGGVSHLPEGWLCDRSGSVGSRCQDFQGNHHRGGYQDPGILYHVPLMVLGLLFMLKGRQGRSLSDQYIHHNRPIHTNWGSLCHKM